ncbi:RpiB/LacA/LacB family sugar-phosphate isomerase, partial [Adlercreutzia sp. DFI.6.23]
RRGFGRPSAPQRRDRRESCRCCGGRAARPRPPWRSRENNDDRVDYPDYAAPVAHDVADGVAERGVLVCGTGIGMAMATDKVPGVRAANIINSEFAALCREH